MITCYRADSWLSIESSLNLEKKQLASKSNQIKKPKFTENQIPYIHKERESVLIVYELCRKQGISEQTFHNRKKKYSGVTLDEPRRLHEL